MSTQLCWEVIPTPRTEKASVTQSIQTDNGKPAQALTRSDLLFIKDLTPADKSKIALMIQQLVKLEQNYASLSEDHRNLQMKFKKKGELCNELEECIENTSAENDRLKNELQSKSATLAKYSLKLEDTNNLLRQSSAVNRKLQKRLDVKKSHVQVQTDDSAHLSVSLQTSFVSPPPSAVESAPPCVEETENPRLKDSMSVFLDKLDTLCDKLSTIERVPQPPVSPLVHNHKTDGGLVCVTPANEEGLSRAKDSIIVVKERQQKSCDVLSLIDEIEREVDDNHNADDETILSDLFFNMKS